MLFSLEELGIEGVDIMIVYGDTQEDVKKEITAQGFTLPQNKEQA